MQLSKYQEDIVNAFKNTKDNLFINAYAGCVDCDTEYFNGFDWTKISEYDEGDKVLSYDIDTREAVLDYPQEYIKRPCKNMYHFYDEYFEVDQVLSAEHSILLNNGRKISALNAIEELKDTYIGLPEWFKYNNSLINDGFLGSITIQTILPKGCNVDNYETKDGYKYCFTMPLGTLILRRNGKIFITGNSGKTFMLLELSKYINTYSVFIAFNKSIQEELKTKIDNPKFKTYTFNGLGYQIMINNWEEEQKKLKENNPLYSIKNLTLDTFKSSEIASLVCADKKDILKLYFLGSTDEDGNDNEEQQYMTFLSDLSHLFDLCRQRMVNFSDEDAIYETVEFYELFSSLMDIPTEIPDLLNKMLEMDIEWATEGKIDFIDQLYVTYFRVMQKQWKVPYWNQFENVCLDEAQDLSRLQQLFISLIKRPKGRVIGVGDFFQSVYSFAGADCHSVDTLKRLYQMKEYQLPINYRCPQKHLRYVNREFEIPIQPRPDAPEGIMKQIEYENLHSFVEKGDCIISRKNADLCSAALMLLEHDKSVYIRDEKLVDKLISKIMSFKNSINSLEDMDNHINNLRTEQQEAIAKRTEKLIEKGIVDNEQVENTTFSDSAIDLLDCVEILLKNYRSKSNSRNDFSSFVNYVRQMLNTKEKRGAIELTSIHQAKGKEWDRVFILNDARVFYEYAKTPDQIQQEKNLSYVAVTRSKDTLYLVHESEEDTATEDDDFDYDEDSPMLFDSIEESALGIQSIEHNVYSYDDEDDDEYDEWLDVKNFIPIQPKDF